MKNTIEVNIRMDISVIIPLYNGRNKIGKCLRTLDQQNFNGTFEVLIVDDASTDNSVEVVKREIRRSKNQSLFTIIECKRNGRAGKARNIGIRAAKGEYILFVDQDDYVDNKFLEKLYALTKNNLIDCVSCNIMDKGFRKNYRCHISSNKISKSEWNRLIWEHGFVLAMLIRRKIIIDNNLFFPCNVTQEDSLYNIGVFTCIKSFSHTEEFLYFRGTEKEGQSTYLNQQKLNDAVKVAMWYVSRYTNKDIMKPFKEDIVNRGFNFVYMICAWLMLNDKDLYSYDLLIKSICWSHKNRVDWNYIFNVKGYSYRKKIILRVLYLFPQLFLSISYIVRKVSFLKKG